MANVLLRILLILGISRGVQAQHISKNQRDAIRYEQESRKQYVRDSTNRKRLIMIEALDNPSTARNVRIQDTLGMHLPKSKYIWTPVK